MVGASSLAGVLGGLYLGSRLASALVSGGVPPVYGTLIPILAAVVSAVLGEAVARAFGDRLRQPLLETPLEPLDREVFANLKEAKVLAGDYREHYNHRRPHGALGYLTPAEFATIEALSAQSAVPAEGPKELESVPRLSL